MVFLGVKTCQPAVQEAGSTQERTMAETAADSIYGMSKRFLLLTLFINVIKKRKLYIILFRYKAYGTHAMFRKVGAARNN